MNGRLSGRVEMSAVSPVADPIAEVKARLDIVDVVGQKVALKKAGRTFKGLCPFHNEKTPSFIVFPDSRIFIICS